MGTKIYGATSAGPYCNLGGEIMIGDYSRSAIYTAFNTETVVGFSCHVFGNGLTPSYLPSFSWGFPDARIHEFEQAICHIGQWKQLKGKTILPEEIKKLKPIFDQQNNFE